MAAMLVISLALPGRFQREGIGTALNWFEAGIVTRSHGHNGECLPRGEAHVGVGVDGRVRLILKFCGCDGAEASGGSRMVVRASQGDGPAGTISSKIGQAERNNFTN